MRDVPVAPESALPRLALLGRAVHAGEAEIAAIRARAAPMLQAGENAMNVRTRWIAAMLVVTILVSAIAAIWAKHESRKIFVELQALVAERDRLEMDWWRLQIEQSTLASHARVEQIARDKLEMRLPEPREIKLVAQ